MKRHWYDSLTVSNEAEACLLRVTARFLLEAPPVPREWLFDEGLDTDAHDELELAGVVERMFGTSRGFAWRFTSRGLMNVARSRAA